MRNICDKARKTPALLAFMVDRGSVDPSFRPTPRVYAERHAGLLPGPDASFASGRTIARGLAGVWMRLGSRGTFDFGGVVALA